MMFAEAQQATAETLGHKITLAGSAGSVVGWATSSNIGVWVGIVIGLAGLALNFYFKRRADRRHQVAHEAYMRQFQVEVVKVKDPEPEDGDE